jgi:hypothetical protein
MKKFIFLIVFFAVQVELSYAYHPITRQYNMLQKGDVFVKQQMTYSDPGSSGEGLVWDFSSNSIKQNMYTVEYTCEDDSIITGTEHETMYKYHLCGDSLFLTGFENPATIMDYHTPLLVMKYPFVYPDSLFSSFCGIGNYFSDYKTSIEGSVDIHADGVGTLILSDKDTLGDVTRICTVRMSSIEMVTDSSQRDSVNKKQELEEIYQWYCRGYRYPLYETVSHTYYYNQTPVSTYQTAFRYLPEDQLSLSDSLNKSVIRQDSIDRQNSGLPPNVIEYSVSVRNQVINIDYTLTRDAHIMALISDDMGVIYKKTYSSDTAGSGYSMSIDCNGLHHGRYILYLNVNGRIYNNKVNL